VSNSDVEAVSSDAPQMTGPVTMMNQDWRDLTFLHWAVDPADVAHLMPPGVRPDTLDVAARPPDHVASSPGVHTEFGLPRDATRPRHSR
jgi:uncharacterized protein YqjF (DUF2071 family)